LKTREGLEMLFLARPLVDLDFLFNVLYKLSSNDGHDRKGLEML
jgi:hypothetical protein